MKCFYRVLALVALSIGFKAQGHAYANPAPVDLGSAGNFTILAKSAVSIGGGHINGNVGLSPAAASYITGFSLTADASNQFSTSDYVTGEIRASDYYPPTPEIMTTAISDMEAAYTDAAGRAAAVTGLGGGTIGTPTGPLVRGVYKWSSALNITTDLTLSGSSTDVWIFEIAGDLILSSGVHIILSGGAKAENIFWQIAGQATLASTSVVNGNILCQTAIVFNDATLHGKALAQSAVIVGAGLADSAVGYIGANPPSQGKAFAYPSPAKGAVINIVYSMLAPGEANIRVYNDNGDLVAAVKEQKSAGSQKTQIPISGFAPGIYLYKVVLTYDSGKVDNLSVQKFGVSK